MTFAGTAGTYASDHWLAAPAPRYYESMNGKVGPTPTWLTGGPALDCPTVAQRRWTADGPYYFPVSPARLDAGRFEQWAERGNLVYSVGGTTKTCVVVPAAGAVNCT